MTLDPLDRAFRGISELPNFADADSDFDSLSIAGCNLEMVPPPELAEHLSFLDVESSVIGRVGDLRSFKQLLLVALVNLTLKDATPLLDLSHERLRLDLRLNPWSEESYRTIVPELAKKFGTGPIGHVKVSPERSWQLTREMYARGMTINVEVAEGDELVLHFPGLQLGEPREAYVRTEKELWQVVEACNADTDTIFATLNSPYEDAEAYMAQLRQERALREDAEYEDWARDKVVRGNTEEAVAWVRASTLQGQKPMIDFIRAFSPIPWEQRLDTLTKNLEQRYSVKFSPWLKKQQRTFAGPRAKDIPVFGFDDGAFEGLVDSSLFWYQYPPPLTDQILAEVLESGYFPFLADEMVMLAARLGRTADRSIYVIGYGDGETGEAEVAFSCFGEMLGAVNTVVVENHDDFSSSHARVSHSRTVCQPPADRSWIGEGLRMDALYEAWARDVVIAGDLVAAAGGLDEAQYDAWARDRVAEGNTEQAVGWVEKACLAFDEDLIGLIHAFPGVTWEQRLNQLTEEIEEHYDLTPSSTLPELREVCAGPRARDLPLLGLEDGAFEGLVDGHLLWFQHPPPLPKAVLQQVLNRGYFPIAADDVVMLALYIDEHDEDYDCEYDEDERIHAIDYAEEAGEARVVFEHFGELLSAVTTVSVKEPGSEVRVYHQRVPADW